MPPSGRQRWSLAVAAHSFRSRIWRRRAAVIAMKHAPHERLDAERRRAVKGPHPRSNSTWNAWPSCNICSTPAGDKSLLVVLQALDCRQRRRRSPPFQWNEPTRNTPNTHFVILAQSVLFRGAWLDNRSVGASGNRDAGCTDLAEIGVG
jgi:hypothetical protein